MDALTIIDAVKQTPDHAGKEVAWVGKLEEQSAGEMTFLIRRKLIKEDQIFYMVRVVLNQALDLTMGDKVLITGTMPAEIDAEHVEQGHINFYVDLENAEVTPISPQGKRSEHSYASEETE